MKILVIRFKQMGDAILGSSVINTLRKTFPTAQIDYVLYEEIISLFKYDRNVSNLISIDKKTRGNIFKYLKKVWEIRKNRYDIIIDLMSTPKSECFTFMSNAKYRIGKLKKNRGLTYTHRIPEGDEEETRVERNLRFLEVLEKEYKLDYDSKISLSVSNEEKDQMKKKMIEKGVDFNKPIVAFSVTAAREYKVYPQDKMIETIKLILEEHDINIIFFGTKNQKEDLKIIAEKLDYNKNIFSNIETKSVRDLLALLKNSDMYFGNEGGARHMAQALNLPSLGIFSPDVSWKSWIPRNNGKHIGIMPSDINSSLQNMKEIEIFNQITPQILLEKFGLHFNTYVKMKKEKNEEID